MVIMVTPRRIPKLGRIDRQVTFETIDTKQPRQLSGSLRRLVGGGLWLVPSWLAGVIQEG